MEVTNASSNHLATKEFPSVTFLKIVVLSQDVSGQRIINQVVGVSVFIVSSRNSMNLRVCDTVDGL